MRCPSREDVYHVFDCAGALRELLQKEIALLRVQLGPTESAHSFGDTVRCSSRTAKSVSTCTWCATTGPKQWRP